MSESGKIRKSIKKTTPFSNEEPTAIIERYLKMENVEPNDVAGQVLLNERQLCSSPKEQGACAEGTAMTAPLQPLLAYKPRSKLSAMRGEPAKLASFKCPHCNRMFLHRGNLKLHLRTHTGEKPFPCDMCGLGFSRRDSLSTHRQTHTGETTGTKLHLCKKPPLSAEEAPYKCDICQRTFKLQYHLQSHMRAHMGKNRPFSAVTGKKFQPKEHPSPHAQMHSQEQRGTPMKEDMTPNLAGPSGKTSMKEQSSSKMMSKEMQSAETPTKKDDDEFTVFGRHVANELRSVVNPHALRQAKLEIQKILCNAQSALPTPTSGVMHSQYYS